jgi:hypothetical protein
MLEWTSGRPPLTAAMGAPMPDEFFIKRDTPDSRGDDWTEFLKRCRLTGQLVSMNRTDCEPLAKHQRHHAYSLV